MRTKLRSKVTLLFMMLGLLLAVPAWALAAELITAEVQATTNNVTVEQGGSATFPLALSANGALSCQITQANPATARAKTDYSVTKSASNVVTGAPSANSPFGPTFPFWSPAPCTGTNSNPPAWLTSPAPYNMPITISVASDVPVGTYNNLIPISSANGATQVTNPTITQGARLEDQNATQITVQVVPPANRAPVANDDNYGTPEDAPLNVQAPGVLGNDTDADNNPLTASLVSDPSNGSVTLNSNGSFNYTPNANYNGPDSFTYTASDGKGGTDTATVSINITAVNDKPVATNDTKSTDEDTPLTFPASDLVANDSAGPPNENQTLTVTAVDQAVNGQVSLGNDGNITFTPAQDFSGQASFKYTVCDNGSPQECSVMTAVVNVNVNPVNDAPVANNDDATTNEDTSTHINVLANDTDVDSASLTAVVVNGPANGSVTQGPNGTLTYTPVPDFNGSDSFTYKATDGSADSNVATVTINVTAVNDEPVAIDDTATTPEDTPVNIPASDLLANDSAGPANESGQKLSVKEVSNGQNGQPVLNSDGSVTFTPAQDFNGDAYFDYTVCDDGGTANGGQNCFQGTAKVTVKVSAVNDAPSFTAGGNQTVNEDAGAQSVAWATNISAGPADEAGQQLTFQVTNDNNSLFSTQPSIAPNGTLSYTSAQDANGSATVSVRLKDDGDTTNNGQDTSAEQTFTITVDAVNDAPSFQLPASPDQTKLVNAGAQSVDNFAINFDPGPDNESGQALLKYVVSNNNTNLFTATGQPAIDNTGKLTYTLAQDAVGTATVSVKAQDDGGTANNGEDTSAAKTFKINVNYGFSGFLQPINYTAHQIGTNPEVSTFKAGSTVPVKFYLTDANGNRVQQATAPQWVTPSKGAATTQVVDETVYVDQPTTGAIYRWDSTAQQYIYNWGTAKNQSGYYWRIGVTLADGKTYYTNISLR